RRPTCTPPARWSGTSRRSSTTVAIGGSARRARSTSPRRPSGGSPTGPFRSTAAPATSAVSRWSGSTATPGCSGSTRAPARSSRSSSPAACSRRPPADSPAARQLARCWRPETGPARVRRVDERRRPGPDGQLVPDRGSTATLAVRHANEQFAHGSAEAPLGSAAMEQRMAAQRQRGAGLNRRGNAAGGTGGATAGEGGNGAAAGRFYTGGPHGTGPRTGPIGPAARSDSTEPDQPAGRHRSPWGRPGRILPIRWGRVVVGALATAGVITAIIGFALVSRGGSGGRGTAAGGSGAAGQQSDSTNPVAVVAPSPAAGSSGKANSGVASPAPGVQEIFPTQLTTAPPPPT